MMQRPSYQQAGFTLIEMIVSLAVFSVVITISIGALLILIATNQKLQAEQSVLTNLSFALDSMTREIRTGTQYYCETRNSKNNNIFDDATDLNGGGPQGLDQEDFDDCPNGRDPVAQDYQGIAFNEGGESITGTGGRILYFFDKDVGEIFRKVGDQPAQSIVSSGIFIEDAQFYVTGSEPWGGVGGEVLQPAVTIYIKAREKDDSTAKAYEIQTTITQRTLDI